MAVIQQGVFHVQPGKFFGHAGIPDAFGAPQSANIAVEMGFDVVTCQLDLIPDIFKGNDRQDGFVETASQEFNLVTARQLPEQVKKIRLIVFEPFQQRPGIVQGHPDLRIILQHVQEGEVTVPAALFKDTMVISDRLVRMDTECKCNFVRHTTSSFQIPDPGP